MRRITLVCLLAMASTSAHAVDGCKALLCFAYPGNPRSLPACAATVEEVLSELARGGRFPHCALVASGGANAAPPGASCTPAAGGAGNPGAPANGSGLCTLLKP
jgi:hypothetical protein